MTTEVPNEKCKNFDNCKNFINNENEVECDSCKLDNLIENLESIIESQNIEINKLKDVSHHNQ